MGERGGWGRVRLKESLSEYDSDFPAPCRTRNRQALEETLAHGHAITKEKSKGKIIQKTKQLQRQKEYE